MKRLWAVILLCLTLAGCGPTGQKTASVSSIYLVAAVLAGALFVAYFFVTSKRSIWFIVLYASILVVNIGYYALSVSSTLGAALNWNRISYLGSVALPMSMLLILLNITGVRYPKWLPAALVGLAAAVFLVAASPGISTIYYKEVSLEVVNGAATLRKVYGPWHILYLVYLLGYFSAMVATVVYAAVKKKVDSTAHGTLLLAAVFVNLGVWLIEQLVRIDFEVLSLSYIISGVFLMGLHAIMLQQQKLKSTSAPPQTISAVPAAPEVQTPLISPQQLELFRNGLTELTRTEKAVYDFYVQGASTKEVMAQLSITENTLKFHNKNLYSKLGVSSRKQLVCIHKHL